MRYLPFLLFLSACTSSLEARISALEASHKALDRTLTETSQDLGYRQAELTHDTRTLTEDWETFRAGYTPELAEQLAANVDNVGRLLQSARAAMETAKALRAELQTLESQGRSLTALIRSHEGAARVNQVVQTLQRTHRDFLARAEQIHRNSERAVIAAESAEGHARAASLRADERYSRVNDLKQDSARLHAELQELRRDYDKQGRDLEDLRRELSRAAD